MPTVVGATVPTLIDVAKRTDPDGKIADIAEILTQTNEVLLDMPFLEGNLPTGHRTTVRTGLPTVSWRLLNGGVNPSKSTSAQIDEQCGLLEAWSEVDCKVAALNGNVGAFRLSEATAFIEAMSQEMASTLFYGNSGLNPEKFTGLSVRYGSTTGGNAQNVITGGSSDTDNTSIWLIVWGPRTITGIFPKGSTAGLQHKDLGEQVVQTSATVGGGRMLAYQEQFVWENGIAVRDWRYAVRICNIDVSNLVAESSNADLQNKMNRAYHRIPNISAGRAAWYMNRTVFEMLDIQRREDVRTGGQLNYGVVDGVTTPMYKQIPIRRVDAILNTESLVS
jgi:hypothetical protein